MPENPLKKILAILTSADSPQAALIMTLIALIGFGSVVLVKEVVIDPEVTATTPSLALATIPPEILATPYFDPPPPTSDSSDNAPPPTPQKPMDFACESRTVFDSHGHQNVETRPIPKTVDVKLLADAVCARLSPQVTDPTKCGDYLAPYEYVSPVIVENKDGLFVQTIGDKFGNYVNIPIDAYKEALKATCGGVPQGRIQDIFASSRPNNFSGASIQKIGRGGQSHRFS